MAKLSKTAQQFLIDGVASTEYGLEIIAAIEAGGGGGGGSLVIGTTPVSGGVAGRMLVVDGGLLLAQQKIPQSAGPSGSIQYSNGTGGWNGTSFFLYDGSVVTYTGTSINNANFQGLGASVTVNDSASPGNENTIAFGSTINVVDNNSHATDNAVAGYFAANYQGTSSLALLATSVKIAKNQNNGSVSQLWGDFVQLTNSAGGTVTSAAGISMQIRNNSGGVIIAAKGFDLNIHDNAGGSNISNAVGFNFQTNAVSAVGIETNFSGAGHNIHYFIKGSVAGDIGLSADVPGVTNYVREIQFRASGAATFCDSTNSGKISIQAPASSGTYAMVLPAALGAGALTNDGAGNLSWTPSTSQSGVFTPAAGTSGNVSSSTLQPASWSQTGSVVTMSGSLQITAMSTGAVTLNITIPVGSNPFTNFIQANGVMISNDSVPQMGNVYSNNGSNQATLFFTAIDTDIHTFNYIFQYQVQ